MDSKIVRNYARLIARTGVNVQKGQEVFVTGSVEIYPFLRLVVEECYLAGASRVYVQYTDSERTKLDVLYGNEELFSHLDDMDRAQQEHFLKNFPCRIFIESEDPDSMKGIDQVKYGRITMSKTKEVWKYRSKWDDECQWTIAGYPSLGWARKVFPDLDDETAVEELLKLLLKVSRADAGDPIANWEEHDKNLVGHMDRMNSLNLRELHYRSKKGTDLKIGLCENVIWEAGGEYTKTKRVHFQPNIPTEECFTSPDRNKTEGIVYATKPLSLRGELVENFSIRFHQGEIVEVHAEKGEEVLKDAIFNSENGRYLGECALVPVDSPINRTGKLFFSTLYDENASCHLAFGRAFPMLIKGYEKMSEEAIKTFPLNDSTVHVDFMIGDETLDIDGIDKDGKTIAIFRNGRFAF